MLENILNTIGISGTPARVYMKLIELGPSSARRLAETLSLPRPSVYDGIKVLVKENMVVERQEDNKKVFAANDPSTLTHSFEEKIQTLTEAKGEFEKMLPTLQESVESVEPKIRFFSGRDGVWKMLRETLWHSDIETCGVWPIKEIIDLFGAEEFEEFHKKREAQNIYIRAIWPHDKIVHYDWLESRDDQLREIRIAPPVITWTMGYWTYRDKVLFVSSQKELFGFVVQSKEFAALMKAQFDVLWGLSKEFKNKK